MIRGKEKENLKREFKRLFKSMDFICDNYLNKKDLPEKELGRFTDIYQQLGLVWEFLSLQCKHWDGYKKSRGKKEVCRICGTLKGAAEKHILLPSKGNKKIGRKAKPNSGKTCKNKQKAMVLKDSISFHGANLEVEVNNSYKSNLIKADFEVNIAAEREVTLKEKGIECSIGEHRIDIDIKKPEKGAKPPYGNFAFELKKKDLKHFPVIFHFDDDFRFFGLTILQ